MTSTELRPQAEEWTSLLQRDIKLEKLEECYRRAMRDHRDRFPINVTDLLIAQERILAEQPRVTVCTFCEAYEEDNSRPPCGFHSSRTQTINHTGAS